MEQPKESKDKPDQKAGYLIIRLKPREGVMIKDQIEVRLASIDRRGEAQIAIRAPKDYTIRKVK